MLWVFGTSTFPAKLPVFEQTNIYVIKSILPSWQNALGVWDLNIPCKTACFLSKQIFML
jgi:hypothetical protein